MRIRLGLFVALSAVLLAALVLLFGSLPAWFKRSTLYTVRFTDAPGLTAGAPVKRSGVKIGAVRKIELDDERGIVRVQVAIEAPHKLRRSDQATLVVGLLGSDASVDFQPRQPEEGEPVDRALLEPGAELVGVRAATVNTLLKGASDVVPTTQETLNDIRKSLQRLDRLAARYEKMTPLVEETVREYRDLARSSRTMIPELQATNTEVRELVRSGREVMPEIQRTSEEYRLLARDARAALPELRKTNSEAQEFLRNARELMPTIERTSSEVRDLASDIRKQIPAMRSTVDDIGAAARNTARLTERADVMLQENRPLIEQTLRELNRATQQANKLLSDSNIRNATETLAAVRTASEPLPRMSRNADYILEQGRESVRRLNTSLQQLDSTLKDIQTTVRPFSERSPTFSRNADEAMLKLNQVLGDMQQLMRVLDRSDGTLKKFLTDPALYNDIDHVAVMACRMLPQVERILKDFETFADKLARHPELMGAGGIVHPSSGLKGPPTPPIVPAAPGPTPPPGTIFYPGPGSH
jgi:ABC-type transporter Mla subunit MlaD